jgi:UDP-glucose:(heptosyl)LPS alpha-1,3-glucosyltransferase
VRLALTYTEASLTGGVERVLVESANAFAAGGHEVHVFASRWQPGVLDAAIARHHVPLRRRPGALVAWQFRRRATAALAAARDSYDVHAAYTAFSPLGGVYLVPSVHLVAYDRARAAASKLRAAVSAVNPTPRAWLAFERQAFAPGGYAHLIAAADDVKRDIIERYGVPEADVTVVPLGFDSARFNASVRARLRERARAELGYRDGERVVLFVANELERKGFDTLLEALARRADPALRLLVVGAGDIGGRTPAIARAGLSGRVRAVGRVTDVTFYQAAADAFALPTRYEPWGLVIVEALASGLPVLTSRLAGAAVAVQEGRTGVLLDDPTDVEEVADGLGTVLGDALAGAPEISASVAPFSWAGVIGRYVDILARYAG